VRTRGDFTIHSFTIPFSEYDLPIYLLPFGDVHKSSPLHHAEKWDEYRQWAALKPRSYFLGMGDYDDLASTSERFILNNEILHDSTIQTLEGLYLNNTIRFARDIEFMKGRLIGLLGGNHFGRFSNNTTTDQKLAELMGCAYLGVCSFVRLSFVNIARGEGHTGSHCVDLFLHHGKGGGGTAGASMNPVMKMAETADADIYLMGDNHQKGVLHKEKLRLTSGKQLNLSHRKQVFARTGSYLKGYEPNTISYIVDALLPPSDLGSIKIELTPRRSQKDGQDREYIDIHASI